VAKIQKITLTYGPAGKEKLMEFSLEEAKEVLKALEELFESPKFTSAPLLNFPPEVRNLKDHLKRDTDKPRS